jgi:CubicO group peptidase (beta-lactamase class C family)
MNTSQLESFIFDKMAATRLPGLSIALVKDDDVVYSHGFGQRDIARGLPVTPETLFGAASITKSFTAIAILQLVERGLLKLTDPVDEIVPSPIKSTGGRITIEHLLTHTTGTPALGYIEAALRHAHQIGGCPLPISGPRDVMTFAQGSDDWAESKPGERWFYLNEGYVLLGEIIERVSGTPYERYVHDHILAPLKMTSSFFAEADVTSNDNWAVPYVLPRDGSAPRPGRYLYNVLGADAALITNVLDLGRYLAMFLRGGRGAMSPEPFAAMIRPRLAMPAEPAPELWGDAPPSSRPSHYGLGLSITDDFLGDTLIGHSGSLIVATSYFGFLPKRNVGVAILTNGNGYPVPQLAKASLAIMLGHSPDVVPFVRTENLLKELTGHYETYRGTVRGKLTKEGDFLRLEFTGGDQPPAPLILVPERLDNDEPRFFTYSEGQRLPAEFRRTEKSIQLIFERYQFRRTGPLNA